MENLFKHWQLRDFRFAVFVACNLLLVAGFLYDSLASDSQPGGGWRRIDLHALQSRIESGELVQTEAHWYHVNDRRTAGTVHE